MMKAISGKAAFEKAVKGKGIVVIDYKGKWCPPCKKLGVVFRKMETALGKMVKFHTVDIDDKKNAGIVKNEKVDSVPHVCFYKNSKKVKCVVGLYPTKFYNEIFSELL